MLNPTTLNTPLSNPQLISDMPETFHSTSHIAHQCNPHHDKPHCTAMVHLTHHNAELRRCSHHSCCHHIALKCRLHIPLTLHAAPKTIAGHRLQHNTCVYTDSQLTNTARFYIYTHKQHTKTAQEYLYMYRKHVLWLMYLDTTVKVEGGKEWRMKPCVLVCQNDNGFSCLIARTLRKKNISGEYKIHPSKSRSAQTGGDR